MTISPSPVHVIGGGLAGSEACWQLVSAGVPVILHEMRGGTRNGEPISTNAHQTDGLAELVCSNSFRSDDWQFNAVGLLHEEMRRAGSLILKSADAHQVPAGGALAMDRDNFSAAVTETLTNHPLVTVVREEVSTLSDKNWENVVVATGPLTSEALSQFVLDVSGEGQLSFFDAIAPIIHFDSIDMSKAWKQSRYDKEGPGGDAAAYINCPMDKMQYEAFIDALLDGPKAEFKDWEHVPYFDGCLPIEVMAERGRETLRYGPMKPVGLTNPHNPTVKAHAIIQLRQDNALGTLYNMVGFQTKLKHGAQADVFRMIPGLENAQFARLGGLHRNTFIQSPKILDRELRLKALLAPSGSQAAEQKHVRFAGQITGVEGYVESAAIGLLAGRFAAAQALGRTLTAPPETTALGALLNHITIGHLEGGSFQPMNINYGLLPQLEAPKVDDEGKKIPLKERGRAKKRLMSLRALQDLQDWLNIA
jgi:methylenetetrahydrofolate--tRNA-(uracil-5-)-methyltransferase